MKKEEGGQKKGKAAFADQLGGGRSQPTGSQDQAAALRAEGVTVTTGALGELMVDFGEFGWFPEALPSEEGEDGEEHDEDE